MEMQNEQLPHPDALFEEARQEVSRKVLAEYLPVIRELRGKRFTFREIAEWLTDRGLEVDHNAVYRTYAKHMTVSEAELEAEQDEEDRSA